MSRFRRVVHSVAAGYLALAAAAIYSLASIPLALHYLSRERFALWALMASISGYLGLIDLGMSGSVSRLLIDAKDDPQQGSYGSLIKTGWLVLLVQGAIIWVAGFLLARPLAGLLAIPIDLQEEFVQLTRWQATTVALGFALRISSHLLYAHQRSDIVSYGQTFMLALNFGLLWFFFRHEQGVFSLVWAGLLGCCANGALLLLACRQLKLFPSAGRWGRLSWRSFQEMFHYGKDLFLVAVGGQLILASQTMIITNRLGLVAAGAWGVGTKAFSQANQLIWRIFDSSAPGLAEMLARGEKGKLLERYRMLVIVSASFGGLCAVTFALCNGPFVPLLSVGKFQWPALNDVLLGVWMIVMAILHCHNSLVGLTKEIRFMRYVYFLEGATFVLVALAFARRGELHTIILASIMCSILFSGAYGVSRVVRLFRLPLLEVGLDWLRPMSALLLRFVPLALATWWLTKPMGPTPRLIIHASLCGTVGFYLFLRHGIPTQLQLELVNRMPKTARGILGRVFACHKPAKTYA